MRLISSIFLVLSLLTPYTCLAYLSPSSGVVVAKPTPDDTYIVGAGETYTTLEDLDGVAGPGDVIKIKAGSYNATQFINSDGASGNEIVIEPYGDGVVYLEANDDSAYYETNDFASDYVIVDGGEDKEIVFRRKPGYTSFYTTLTRITGDNVTLYRCQFVGPTGPCTDTTNSLCSFGSPTTVYSSSFYPNQPRVLDCTLNGGGDSHKGIYVHGAINGVIAGNDISGTTGNGIQINPRGGHYVEGINIFNNAFHDVGPCDGTTTWDPLFILISGMTSPQGDPPWIEGLLIYNNIFWDLYGQSVLHISPGFDCPLRTDGGMNRAVRFYNNTIYSIDDGTLDQYGFSVSSSSLDDNCPDQFEIYNNIFEGIKTGTIHQSGSGVIFTTSNNLEEGEPGFVSISDAIDTFLTIGAAIPGYDTNPPVLMDYAGETRDTTTPDVGAFEFVSGTETRYYLDADGDGYSPGDYQDAESDPGETWYTAGELTATSGDCNDSNVAINPGATEICGNGVDEDCDGTAQACATVKGGFIKGGYSG